jgi:hypothetical protein
MRSERRPNGRDPITRMTEPRERSSSVSYRPEGGWLEGEMLDLYAAILIVIPVALFLKSLWM